MRIVSPRLFLSLFLLAAIPSAFADTVTWATWNAPTTVSPTAGVETGTIGSVNVTYTGEIQFVNASNAGHFNYFQPLSTYVGGVVGNASTNGGMIAIDGNPGVTDTFTFSTPLVVSFSLKSVWANPALVLNTPSTMTSVLPPAVET